MRHSLVKLTGLLLVLMLALTGCNLIGIDQMKQLDVDFAKLDKDFQTVVAEYDGGTVTKGDVLGTFASEYSYYAQMYSMFGMSMTNEVVENVKQESVEHAVRDIALAKAFDERGLSLSDDKLAEIQSAADENYQQAYDSFYANTTGKDEALRVRQTEYDLYQNGFNKDVFYNSQLAQAKEELVEENVKAEVEVTEDDLKAAYDEQVTADEGQYAGNPGAFESAMSSEDEVVTWMPEGYRTVKHILVKPEDDVLKAVTDARTELDNAQKALEDLQAELDALNVNDDEPADEAEEAAGTEEAAEAEAEPTDVPRTAEEINADIEAANARIDAAKTTVADAEAACLASVKDKTDEIYAKIESGEDFGSLIAEYGEDPGMQNEPTASRGYYVCADSTNWDKNFTAGAMLLANVGDVTATPVISTSGVHIIRYESDVVPGAVALEDIHDAFYNKTLTEKQDEHFTETVDGWVEALNPVYHVDAFKIGEE